MKTPARLQRTAASRISSLPRLKTEFADCCSSKLDISNYSYPNFISIMSLAGRAWISKKTFRGVRITEIFKATDRKRFWGWNLDSSGFGQPYISTTGIHPPRSAQGKCWGFSSLDFSTAMRARLAAGQSLSSRHLSVCLLPGLSDLPGRIHRLCLFHKHLFYTALRRS